MKILIDIGHPAHVHYFKNFIKLMKKENHQFLITARNRDQVFDLLRAYNIDFIDRGKGSTNFLGKLFYLFRADFFIHKIAKKFKPDLFLGFGSPYVAHTSRLLRKSYISFDDTEHSSLNHLIYAPFTDLICTPSCFRKSFGKKHIRFNGYFELCYLHPDYFSPDPSILSLLELEREEKYVIMRFISWSAIHDPGHSGLNLEMKRKSVEELSKEARVFISSERKLPEDLKKFQLKIPPERMHDALYYANLYFGESGTMATEAAVLGTPSVRVSTIAKLLGNYGELKDKYGLLYFFDSGKEGLEMALKLIKKNSKSEWKAKKEKMLKDKIDVTQFMIDTVINYKF